MHLQLIIKANGCHSAIRNIIFSVSDKMLKVIAYVFEKLEEVTPLMLQKLLYFIQGESYVLNGKPMFCKIVRLGFAGPVYPEFLVYV